MLPILQFENREHTKFQFFFVYLLSPSLWITPPGLTTQMPVGQMPVGGATVSGPRQRHKGGRTWMCGQYNVRASAEDNTGQNTDKGHAPNPRREIKIPDPAKNRIRNAGLEGGDSTHGCELQIPVVHFH